jgi:hypothetical protein
MPGGAEISIELATMLNAPPGIRSSVLLGSRDILWCAWCVTLVAWIVVFLFWLRTLMAYGKKYREYEQARRQYEKAHGEPPESLRLTQERLHRTEQSFGVTLQYLRRLSLFLSKDDQKLSHQRSLVRGVPMRLWIAGRFQFLQFLNDVMRSGIHKRRKPNDQAHA